MRLFQSILLHSSSSLNLLLWFIRYGILNRFIPRSDRSGSNPRSHVDYNELDNLVHHERCLVGTMSRARCDLGRREIELVGQWEEGEKGGRERCGGYGECIEE